jgi:hypothetical protein
MSEWWSYRPEDFLLFSEQVYWRLFEIHNAALGPWLALAVAMAVAIVALLLLRDGRSADRAICGILAAAWIVVGWGFVWSRYASINWAATYVAPLFLLQALLTVWIGSAAGRLSFNRRIDARALPGLALLVYALLLHPLTPLLDGRSLRGAELFAVAPDPTAIATLGLLTMARRSRAVLVLFAVPWLWCLASAATLFTIGTWEAWLPLTAALVAFFALMLRPRSFDAEPHRSIL